jgi:hypothetical protein
MDILNNKIVVKIFSNTVLYWFIVLIMVIVLTTINNLYFYKHVNRTNERAEKRIEATINNMLQNCYENNISNEICYNNISKIAEDAMKKYPYIDEFIIKDYKGNIYYKKEKTDFDKVTVLNAEVILPDISKSRNAKFKNEFVWDNKVLLVSVIRSMTLSYCQLYDKWQKEGYDEAIKFFKQTAWLRSRPALGFLLFSLVLFLLWRVREKSIKKKEDQEDEKLRQEFEKQLRRVEEYEQEKNKLQKRYDELYQKFQQYENIINPPLSADTFFDLLEIDTSGMGNRFRKVLEKVVFEIYENHFHKKAENLSSALWELQKNDIITSEIKSYGDIIRIYGNLDSHYNQSMELSKDLIVALANHLLDIIEEAIDKKLLDPNIKKVKKYNKLKRKWEEIVK